MQDTALRRMYRTIGGMEKMSVHNKLEDVRGVNSLYAPTPLKLI
jgi:hypothetical protein